MATSSSLLTVPAPTEDDMQATAEVEHLIEVMIGELGDSARADQVVAVTRSWLADDDVTMTDEQLKGALVALQLIWHRRPHFGLPAADTWAAIADVGATLVCANRAALADSSIADVLADLEAHNTLSGDDGNGQTSDPER